MEEADSEYYERAPLPKIKRKKKRTRKHFHEETEDSGVTMMEEARQSPSSHLGLCLYSFYRACICGKWFGVSVDSHPFPCNKNRLWRNVLLINLFGVIACFILILLVITLGQKNE